MRTEYAAPTGPGIFCLGYSSTNMPHLTALKNAAAKISLAGQTGWR
jgi:hypothetical protein